MDMSLKLVRYVFLLSVMWTCCSADDLQGSHYQQVLTTFGKRINAVPESASQILTPESHAPSMYLQQAVKHAKSLLQNRDSLTAASYNVSGLCLNHTWTQIIALAELQMWAIAMLDAAGKPSSGFLTGNMMWYGDYDECVNVTAVVYPGPQNETKPQHPFTGRYCKIGIPLVTPSNQTEQQPAMMGTWPLGTMGMGLCVPNSCNETDLLGMLEAGLSMVPFLNLTMPDATIALCQREELEYGARAITVLTVLGVFIALLVVGTAYDVLFIQWLPYILHTARLPEAAEKLDEHDEEVVVNSADHSEQTSNNIRYRKRADEKTPLLSQHADNSGTAFEPGLIVKILLSFSIYTNGGKILGTGQSSGSLRAIHGIRFLSMSWVILGHTVIWTAIGSDNIFPFLTTWGKRWTAQAILNALVSVDSFFTLSGLLVTYTVLKEMKSRGGVLKLNWGMFYFHRFWRLTPPYMLVIMVYVPLLQYFSNGPMWPQKGTEVDYCRTTWWTNLLYINNFVYTDKMCMGWSWYLSNDMQFYVVSPLLLIPLYYSGVLGGIVCLMFLLAVFITSGVISSVYELPASMFAGIGNMADPKSMQDYQFLYYFKPYCRMGPYIIGTITGYLLYKTDCKFRMSRIVNLLGWAIAAVCCLSVLYGLYDESNSHPLSTSVAAFYNAVHRSVWAVGLCWVIFACATGYGGFVNTLLSWEALIPLSRLSYCAYLLHPIIMEIYQFSRKTPTHLDDLEVIYLFFGNLVAAYAVAFVTSLAFEAPMMGLEKAIFKRQRKN